MTEHPITARAARAASSGEAATGMRKVPITPERIADAAFEVVAGGGYDALTIRSIAKLLGTGPSSLYAHIATRADIDDLLVGRLCSAIALPEPDPARWEEQISDVCTQLRDQYLAYPGISRAALARVPDNLEFLRVSEGMLTILLAGGIAPQTAAWAIDALFLYVAAYTLELSMSLQLHSDHGATEEVIRDDVARRLRALPEETFPQLRKHATELTAGSGHQRYDFALGLLIDNLRHAVTPQP